MIAALAVFVIASANAFANDDAGCPCEGGDPMNDQLNALFATKLTNDWGGFRRSLAERGVSLDADYVQFLQGVTQGGVEQKFLYGGNANYVLNFDVGKLGGMKGGFVKLRAETQVGESINPETGSVLAANTAILFPRPNGHLTAITELTYTQFLSETFAVFAGRLNTFGGDANAFASGRGRTQFMNTAMVINPIAFRTIPYTALGGGFVILRDKQPLFTFSVISPENVPTTAGISDAFETGVAMAGELRIPTNFFGLPGHQLFAATWSSRDYVSVNQDPRFVLATLLTGNPGFLQRKSDSWSAYYNFDQYLFTDPCDPTRGWGVFGRFGISDANPNPLEWFVSFGIGGNSPIRGRGQDTFGIGYYYSRTSNELNLLRNVDDGQGVEFFYNYAVTPYFRVTPDVQILFPGRSQFDTAVVAGIRAQLVF